MTDTKTTDVVTFAFEGTGVRCMLVALLIMKLISFWCITLLSVQCL